MLEHVSSNPRLPCLNNNGKVNVTINFMYLPRTLEKVLMLKRYPDEMIWRIKFSVLRKRNKFTLRSPRISYAHVSSMVSMLL
jgi:hypothetical protein